MSLSRDDYVAANRSAWDASAEHHRRSQRFNELRSGFAAGQYSCLDPVITGWLERIGLSGKSVAQLCCNNGREILSIENLGAGRCVGFDQSAEFLGHAAEFKAAGNLTCTFVETDIYRIPDEFSTCFDLAVVTIGVFGWMPDLAGFMGTASRLLRPGGALLVYEQHPIMNMVEPFDAEDPHRLVNSYFKPEPFEEQGAIVYDGTETKGGPTLYWFAHPLSDVFTACLGSGLTIEAFEEYPHNISSDEFEIYNNRPAQLPQSFVLLARKPAE